MELSQLVKAELRKLMPSVSTEELETLKLGDAPWDSLRHLEIINAVEKKFSIQLDIDDALNATDTAKLIQIITSKVAHEPDKP